MSRNRKQVDAIRAEMKRAVRYRSGPDLMNEVYLGGLATAHIMSLLGGSYGNEPLQHAIDNASDGQIEDVYTYDGYQWILGHYKKAGSKLYEFETIRREVD